MINVIEKGVAGDGQTLNTKPIQDLIDHCAAAGGGTLLFPPGAYLTGSLMLRSNITLALENGATLLGSPRMGDYPLGVFGTGQDSERMGHSRFLLGADGEANIRITGGGTIDGQGIHLQDPGPAGGSRPANILFHECRNVALDGIRLRNSGGWMQHYTKCSVVRLLDLDVWNHGARNNDGIDIDGCRDVRIVGCRVDSGDDAICLKSGSGVTTENVLVRDCVTRTYCNHFKLGTESAGGFRNVRAEGLVMVSSDHPEPPPRTGGAHRRGACGIALGCVDGGRMENICVSNVTMDGVRVPFFVRLGDRGKPAAGTDVRKPVGAASDIKLSGVLAKRATAQGCFVAGLPDARIRNVEIRDCDLEFEGGGGEDLLAREIPENRESYPAMEMFGAVPAWGVFCRDVEGVNLSGLTLRLLASDARNALMLHRCSTVRTRDVAEEAEG